MTKSGFDLDEIEKVARALCEHAIIKAYTRQDRVEELAPFRAVEVDHLWRNHIPEAKAAIAAMQPAPQWQGIESAPRGLAIIGLRDPSQTGRQPAFIGEVYDLRKNALIDVWSGRWAVCTHWMPLLTPPAGGSDE